MADQIPVQGTKTPDPSESESDLDSQQLGDVGDTETTEEEESPSEKASEDEEEETGESEGDEEDSEDDEDDETEESEEEESEEETPIGDKPEDRAEYARIPVKALKAKYPNIFKDFPQLRSAFFEYPKYTELFADVESAREAAQKAQEFDILEQNLVDKGDVGNLFTTLQENNPKALKKIIQNLAPAVRNLDLNSYAELTTPIIEELLYHAANHGAKVGNKNLQLAARHIANFVFANGGDIPDISKRSQTPKGPSEAEVQLEQERESYAKEKFHTALEDVVKIIAPDMNSILNNKLDGLSPFEKRQVIKEARGEIDRILQQDKGFQQTLRNLWKKASEQGYSSESKSRIKRAWLDRAKLVAPSVRNRLKQEALSAKTPSRETSEEKEQEGKVKFKVETQKKTFPERGGKTPSGKSSSRVLDPKKIDWRKTTDRDILDMP